MYIGSFLKNLKKKKKIKNKKKKKRMNYFSELQIFFSKKMTLLIKIRDLILIKGFYNF